MTLNDSTSFSTDECQKISMQHLLREAKKQLLQQLLHIQIESCGIETEVMISSTGNGGKRYWLKCPACLKRKGLLFQHPLTDIIACRQCLGLKYRKRSKNEISVEIH
jgi:hypothetical protein